MAFEGQETIQHVAAGKEGGERGGIPNVKSHRIESPCWCKSAGINKSKSGRRCAWLVLKKNHFERSNQMLTFSSDKSSPIWLTIETRIWCLMKLSNSESAYQGRRATASKTLFSNTSYLSITMCKTTKCPPSPSPWRTEEFWLIWTLLRLSSSCKTQRFPDQKLSK